MAEMPSLQSRSFYPAEEVEASMPPGGGSDFEAMSILRAYESLERPH